MFCYEQEERYSLPHEASLGILLFDDGGPQNIKEDFQCNLPVHICHVTVSSVSQYDFFAHN